jgi:hypothetical protein
MLSKFQEFNVMQDGRSVSSKWKGFGRRRLSLLKFSVDHEEIHKTLVMLVNKSAETGD